MDKGGSIALQQLAFTECNIYACIFRQSICSKDKNTVWLVVQTHASHASNLPPWVVHSLSVSQSRGVAMESYRTNILILFEDGFWVAYIENSHANGDDYHVARHVFCPEPSNAELREFF